jgi:hypothetical protein
LRSQQVRTRSDASQWENRQREFFIPAEIVNRYGQPELVDEDAERLGE